MSVLNESYIRLLFSIIVLIVLLWILFRFRANKNPRPDSLEILRKRLKNGEITEAEFEAARKQRERE